jgi:hypothetical protein
MSRTRTQKVQASKEVAIRTINDDQVVEGTIVEDSETKKRVFVFTPYQAAKVVNETLTRAGIDKQVPPQMLYTYVRKDKIASTIADDGRIMVDPESLLQWTTAYVNKLTSKAAA